MIEFIETYAIKGYAKFDKIHNIIMLNNNYIPYEDIDCFEFEETIEVGTEPDIPKELFSYVFAAAIPITTLLDENSTRRGIYVATSLKAIIWLKNKDVPIVINFLPKEKTYKINSEPYQTYHKAFKQLEDAMMKIMTKLYGDDAPSILEAHLKERKTSKG